MTDILKFLIELTLSLLCVVGILILLGLIIEFIIEFTNDILNHFKK